jgi:hypothetical protein
MDYVLTLILCNIVMYEIVKNVVSSIHLFMILMKTWIFESSRRVYSIDYRV